MRDGAGRHHDRLIWLNWFELNRPEATQAGFWAGLFLRVNHGGREHIELAVRKLAGVH